MKKIVIVLILAIVSSTNLNAQKEKLKVKQKEQISKIVQSYMVSNSVLDNKGGKPDARKRKS